MRQGNLRSKYDVLIFPHAGGTGNGLVYGGVQGSEPRPYKKTEDMPHLGIQDSTDDMRGGLGYDGLQELYKFVNEGGVLITEGGTSTIFPEFNLTPGISIEQGEGLYVRGSVLKAVIADKTSPVVYGYDQNALAVYFNQGADSLGRRRRRLRPRRRRPGRRGSRRRPGELQHAAAVGAAEADARSKGARRRLAGTPPAADNAGRGGRGGGRGGGRWRRLRRRGGGGATASAPRVLLSFPSDPNDMLLSGVLVGGEAIAGRAVVVDAPVGKGHVVMFANRPTGAGRRRGISSSASTRS